MPPLLDAARDCTDYAVGGIGGAGSALLSYADPTNAPAPWEAREAASHEDV